jgi:hypothetical protein
MKLVWDRRFGRALLVLSACLVLMPAASADSDPGYDLSWWTVDNGGATAARAGTYSLGSTIGQPDAGTLITDGWTLAAGFWGGVAVPHRIYLPLVLRSLSRHAGAKGFGNP